MNESRKNKVAFGDFQTPYSLALKVCERLGEMGINPATVIEPTCGVGAFVMGAAAKFPQARHIVGVEINDDYLSQLRGRLPELPDAQRIDLTQADFFQHDWPATVSRFEGPILVLGNLPWVTNSTQGGLGATNLPAKSNFQNHSGFDAISGKANFDISEWMLIDILRWFAGRAGDIAMLVKTAVARKVLAHAQRMDAPVRDSCIIGIDAKKEFDVSVEACILVIRLGEAGSERSHDYSMFDSLDDRTGRRIGHRHGMTIRDLDLFQSSFALFGQGPQKWRSGVKHDASSVMEFTAEEGRYRNGLGGLVELESRYLFPLMKGADIGSHKEWRKKFVLVTQKKVGESTDDIRSLAPLTWNYLLEHGAALDARASSIYVKNPRFSVFGVGEYSYKPWKIAICGLYKHLRFRLVGPIDERPVMFDDTVYSLSFDTQEEAERALTLLTRPMAIDLLQSLVFWDDKRPVKTSILNLLEWNKIL